MDIAPREKFGLGSKLKKFVRKVIPNEIAEVATKAAPFVAPFNPLVAAGMAGLGGFDKSGSISGALRSGALTYGLGNLARVVGGAGFQAGLKAPGTGTGFGSYFTSPMSGQQLFGTRAPVDSTVSRVEPLGIEELAQQTGTVDKLPQSVQKDIIAEDLFLKESPTSYKNLLGKIIGRDATLAERTQAIKDLGGKAIKDIYTTDEGKIDKFSVAATIGGASSYIEAKKLAEEADLVDDADDYTEEMYEADKAKYAEKYGEYLTPSAFGLKEGGRVKLQGGGIPSIMLEKKDYNFMDLVDEDAEEEYYKKKAEELDRKYNPQNYNDIIPKEKPMDEYMLNEIMSERGMNTLSEDTRDKAMKMYAERAYKKGQISEDEYREIMGFKVGGRVGYKVGTTPVYLKDSLFKDKDYLSGMKNVDEVEELLKELLDEKRVPTKKEYEKGIESYRSAQDKMEKFKDKYIDRVEALDYENMDPKDRFPMEVLVIEKMLEDRGDRLDKMDTDVGEMINKMIQYKKEGGIINTREAYAMGSEVPIRENQAGVREMDFRQTGGFVPPIGVKEKADDIPAMLSNNEFVFTADAVRAAGGGSVNKGAQKMYNLMKSLENKVV